MLLLSTIGSRGDVQPLVALALRLRDLGADARFCVPPDFQPWIEGLGFAVTPIGPSLRSTAAPSTARPTREQLAEPARQSVADQFATVRAAAEGCAGIVGATARPARSRRRSALEHDGQARALAPQIRTDGADLAARRLLEQFQ